MQIPQEMPQEMPEEMPEEGEDLLSAVEAKMQEEGFAENVMNALEGAKDMSAAAGMLAGALVSNLYDPGDSEEDVMAAIQMALKEVMMIAQDMGAQFDEQTATAAANQAGQMVIDLMDQHEGGEQPQQGMKNPYQGFK